MTRRLARCPVCRRQVATLNDPTRLRAHYPKPYSWYDKHHQPHQPHRGPAVTTTPEQHTETIKTAIGKALEDTNGKPRIDRIDAIYTAVKQAYAGVLPALIEQALTDPAAQKAITTGVFPTMLATLEDELNDDHDDPKTPEQYRPGLRRAARLIRDTRRACQEDTQ